MRRLTGAVAGVVLTLLPARTGIEHPVLAEATEAVYALEFNDELVGHAYFTLTIDATGRYRFDAFTVPAGKLSRAAGQEVLETSDGVHRPSGTRSATFSQSAVDGERSERIDMNFDWHAGQLTLQGPSGQVAHALLPDTHDRLSYLLAARRLARRDTGPERIQVAAPQATTESLLRVVAEETLDTPAGPFSAVAVERLSGDEEGQRTIWFDTAERCRLPLKIEQLSGENRTVMQLQRCIDRGSATR
jgi:hypothetical protein